MNKDREAIDCRIYHPKLEDVHCRPKTHKSLPALGWVYDGASVFVSINAQGDVDPGQGYRGSLHIDNEPKIICISNSNLWLLLPF